MCIEPGWTAESPCRDPPEFMGVPRTAHCERRGSKGRACPSTSTRSGSASRRCLSLARASRPIVRLLRASQLSAIATCSSAPNGDARMSVRQRRRSPVEQLRRRATMCARIRMSGRRRALHGREHGSRRIATASTVAWIVTPASSTASSARVAQQRRVSSSATRSSTRMAGATRCRCRRSVDEARCSCRA